MRLGANVVFACRDVDRANKAIARIACAITPSNALDKSESKFGIPVLPHSAKRLWLHIFHSIQWNNELSLLYIPLDVLNRMQVLQVDLCDLRSVHHFVQDFRQNRKVPYKKSISLLLRGKNSLFAHGTTFNFSFINLPTTSKSSFLD